MEFFGVAAPASSAAAIIAMGMVILIDFSHSSFSERRRRTRGPSRAVLAAVSTEPLRDAGFSGLRCAPPENDEEAWVTHFKALLRADGTSLIGFREGDEMVRFSDALLAAVFSALLCIIG